MNKSCEIAEEYYYYTPFHVLEWTQLTCSLVSIILVVYTSVVYLRKSWFEEVFKETIYILYLLIFLHSALTAILQAAFIVMRHLASVPCEAQFDMRWCVIRIVLSGIFPSFVGMHANVTVQRIVTTFSKNRRLHYICARLALLFTFVYCVAYVLFGYLTYPLHGTTPFCTGYHTDAASVILSNTTILMFIDVLNVIIDAILLVYNKKKMHSMNKALPLAVKFRYRQTFYSIQQFFPVAVCHAAFYSVQFVTFHIGFTIKTTEAKFITFNGFCYMVPWYCVVCPALILWLIRRGRLQRNCHLRSIVGLEDMTERYFTALQIQWSEVPRPERSEAYEPSSDRDESTTT